MRFMDDARKSVPQLPPPTIWNANNVLKVQEFNLSRSWPPKLGTITELNNNQLNNSRTSTTFPSYPNDEPINVPLRSEPVTLKVPVMKETQFFQKNRVKKKLALTENTAAILIQRAFRKYRLQKTQSATVQDSFRTYQASSSNRRSEQSKSWDSVRPDAYRSDKYSVSQENHRCLSFKDYLKEGSLYFPERESVIVFGGIDPHSKYGDGRNTGRNIFRYNSEVNQWDLVGELPQPRHHHAVAFLKGKVYLAGGTDPRDDEKGKTVVVGTVWSFDPVSRSWYRETEMLTPRKNFGLTVMNGRLLAVGGQDKDGRILSSVEKYDPVTRTWEYIARLNTERTGAAVTKFNDTIWVAGGMTSSRKTPLTSSVESYDAKYNVWTEQSPLRFPRCFGCLFATNDTLYFIGGAGRVSEKERTTSSCNAIDVWNPKEEEWKLHFAMSIPRHGHAVAYLGTQILIIGGVTTAYLRALTDVECFCCERKTWVRGLTGLPVPLSGHGAVTLPPASLM